MKILYFFLIITIIHLFGIQFEFNDVSATEIKSQNTDGVVKVVVAGDFFQNDKSKEIIQKMNSTNSDIILFAGDVTGYNPDDSAESWFNMTDYLGKEKIFFAMGNHDLPEKTQFLEYYGLEKQFFSFDKKNVHFLALSRMVSFTEESEQYRFVQNDLKNIYANSEIDWIIVWLHHPLYSDTVRASIDFRNAMQPLFDLYEVDIVIQAHVHGYERTNPLRFNNTITDYSQTLYINPEGQIYITAGTGGADRHHWDRGEEEWSIIQNFEEYGFLNLEIYETFLTGEFKTVSGNFVDEFQICSQSQVLNKNKLNVHVNNKEIKCYDSPKINPKESYFSNTNFSRVDLSNANLEGVVLTGANLSYSNLTGVDLSGRDLSHVDFYQTNLSNTNLEGVVLTGANLSYSNLTGVDLAGADLSNANLSGSDLSNANLEGVVLTGANLSYSNLTGVDLSDKDLSNANLSGSDLSNANLKGTILTGSFLQDSNLTGVDLSDKDLSNANLSGSDLSNADLTRVNLENANLFGADLSNANLEGTILTGAMLSHSNFTGANLGCTNFSELQMNELKLGGIELKNNYLECFVVDIVTYLKLLFS